MPYLYYTFYCDFAAMVGYLSLISILGVSTICIAMFDVFASPRFRSIRACSFIGLGLSGVIPATHYAVVSGWNSAVNDGSLGWLIIMAALYISGAVLYALRVPERCLPGYCDIWVSCFAISVTTPPLANLNNPLPASLPSFRVIKSSTFLLLLQLPYTTTVSQ